MEAQIECNFFFLQLVIIDSTWRIATFLAALLCTLSVYHNNKGSV